MSPGTCAAKFFKWVLHNMEVISKKYWAVAFTKKKRKVQQKTSSLVFVGDPFNAMG